MNKPLDVDNLYSLLGVSVSASPEEIRSAYRCESKKWHPDVNSDPNAPDYMARLNEAFSILSDPVRRFDYDRKPRPTPKVVLSTSDVKLARFTRQQKVTVVSDSPITDVDFPQPSGLGWTATVKVIDMFSLELMIQRDRTNTHGVSFLDFHVDGCAQSIRVEVDGATTVRTTRSGPVGVLLRGVTSLAFLFIHLTGMALLGYLIGFSAHLAHVVNGSLEVRDTQTSLNMLKILAGMAGASALYMMQTNFSFSQHFTAARRTGVVSFAAFLIAYNSAWPMGTALLLLGLFLLVGWRVWVRL